MHLFSRVKATTSRRWGKAGHAALIGIAVALSFAGTAATDPAARFESLGHKMTCTCGCAQVLLECNHMGCPDSPGLRDELAQAVNGGQSDKAILAGFVERYGATVLTAPPTHGFDLLAWIMPFAVSAAALIGTIFLVRHWARQQPPLAAAGAAPYVAQAQGDESLRARIRQETGTDGAGLP